MQGYTAKTDWNSLNCPVLEPSSYASRRVCAGMLGLPAVAFTLERGALMGSRHV